MRRANAISNAVATMTTVRASESASVRAASAWGVGVGSAFGNRHASRIHRTGPRRNRALFMAGSWLDLIVF